MGRRDDRWRARPVWSTLIRGLVLLGPVACGVAVGVTFSRAVPPPHGLAEAGWWALLFGLSFVTTELVSRVGRRLLPLAVLLKLTMLFPDKAPSRFAMARRAGNVRNLEERVRRAREHGVDDDPTRAAETILELVAALSAHDRRTRGHSERVRALTDLLATAMPLKDEDRHRLRWAALLHDIGKLEVPGRILNKPGKPDTTEWDTIRRHPDEGARLAGPLLPWLGEWGLAIEQHHERFDGRGYPRELAGKKISRGARMLAITDAFETMTAPRPYRKPLGVGAAREELARMAGTQFDPRMVRTFVGLSLGRLWWIAGPMSWLAQLPLIGPGTQAGRVAAAGLTKAFVGITAVTVSGGLFGGRAAGSAPVRPTVEAAAPTVAVANHHQLPLDARDAGEPSGTEDPSAAAEAADDAHAGDGEGPGGDTTGPGAGSGGGAGGDGADGGADDEKEPTSSSNLVDTAVEGVGGAVDGVTGVVDDMAGTVSDTADGLTDTIEDAAGGLLNSAGGLTDAP